MLLKKAFTALPEKVVRSYRICKGVGNKSVGSAPQLIISRIPFGQLVWHFQCQEEHLSKQYWQQREHDCCLKQASLTYSFKFDARQKANAIMNDETHILPFLFEWLPYSPRIRDLRTNRVNFWKSFISFSVRIFKLLLLQSLLDYDITHC